MCFRARTADLMMPTYPMSIKLLSVVVGLSLIIGLLRMMHLLRGRRMRSFATRRGFKYIGPPAPPQWWWNPSRLEIHPPLTRSALCGFQARQVWNVIEGNVRGTTVFIFDSIWGSKGGQPLTLIACKTERNPFVVVTSADRVVQARGWTVLQGVSFLGFTWTMSIKRIDGHLDNIML
jgi:hypothetical protein